MMITNDQPSNLRASYQAIQFLNMFDRHPALCLSPSWKSNLR